MAGWADTALALAPQIAGAGGSPAVLRLSFSRGIPYNAATSRSVAEQPRAPECLCRARPRVPNPVAPRVSPVSKKTAPLDFEHSLRELESLVERMEQGELTLEESLGCFERGVALTRSCQKSLAEAEQKVRILVERDGREELVPFSEPSPPLPPSSPSPAPSDPATRP